MSHIIPILAILFLQWSPLMATFDNPIKVIAHRGGAGSYTENTMQAFANAMDLGVDGIEMDIQLSADGEILVHHDYFLNSNYTKDSSGHWVQENFHKIKDLTTDMLALYTLGDIKLDTFYTKKYPKLMSTPGLSIPKLQDVFELARQKGNTTLTFYIEIKTSPNDPDLSADSKVLSKKLVSLIENYDLKDQVYILSFDWSALQHIHRQDSSLKTVYLTDDKHQDLSSATGISSWTLDIPLEEIHTCPACVIKKLGGYAWGPHYRQVTKEQVKQAHDIGIKVSVWTPNTMEDINTLQEYGVDSITTDYPEIMLSQQKM